MVLEMFIIQGHLTNVYVFFNIIYLYIYCLVQSETRHYITLSYASSWVD